jgi:metal-sulfur cluster biosynthetic enzyme
MVSKEQVLNMLAHIEDPELHRSLTDLNMVRDV